MKAVKAANKKQLNDAFYVRKKVFVEEQKVPEELEMDEHDDKADHIVLYDETKPIGTGRLRIVDNAGKLERICILPEYRGRGAGKIILDALENLARTKNVKKVKLNAQTHAENFYKKAGYKTVSDIFMDAGIPHVSMVKTID